MATLLSTSNMIFDTVFFLTTVTDLEAFLNKSLPDICEQRGCPSVCHPSTPDFTFMNFLFITKCTSHNQKTQFPARRISVATCQLACSASLRQCEQTALRVLPAVIVAMQKTVLTNFDDSNMCVPSDFQSQCLHLYSYKYGI